MSNYRRAREGRTYFFTVVTHRRRPVLCDYRVHHVLHEALQLLQVMRPLKIDAWVLLPDHMHCIWTLPPADADYSARWGWLKKELTKAVRPWLSGNIPAATVWQQRFWEHQIRDEEDFSSHCDYIRYNPVRHGLVARPQDWRWSTTHRFIARGVYPTDWGAGGIEIDREVGNE